MDYRRLIKSRIQYTVYDAEATPPKEMTEVKTDNSEMLALLRQIAEKNVPMPEMLENSVLTDEEVDLVMFYALELEKLLPDIPLEKNRVLPKQFLYNIPREMFEGIRYCHVHQDTPMVLNPIIMLYPFLMQNSGDAFGLYLMKLREMLDDNREVIENDAQAYLADKQYDADANNEEDIEDAE